MSKVTVKEVDERLSKLEWKECARNFPGDELVVLTDEVFVSKDYINHFGEDQYDFRTIDGKGASIRVTAEDTYKSKIKQLESLLESKWESFEVGAITIFSFLVTTALWLAVLL